MHYKEKVKLKNFFHLFDGAEKCKKSLLKNKQIFSQVKNSIFIPKINKKIFFNSTKLRKINYFLKEKFYRRPKEYLLINAGEE